MDVSPLHDRNESYHDDNHLTLGENNTFENNEVAEPGKSLSDIVQVQDAPGLVSNGIPVPVDMPTATTQKTLCKSATFPSSKFSMLDQPFIGGSTEMHEGVHEQDPMKSENAPCTRSTSLPAPTKLVSALKGGRENQGIPLKKLSLKWAPEVYDPPVTLLSHTVKGHHRSRSAKKTIKHKHKSKSSHGSSSSSSSDKKQYRKYAGKSESRSSSKILTTRDRSQLYDTKPQESTDRLQVADSKPQETIDAVLINDLNRSTIQLLDFAVSGQDTKCGSNYLRTSLAKLCVSVAEA